jgi:hypothetical protein
MTRHQLTLVILSGIGLFTPACGASPDQVCDHMIGLMKKEVGEEAVKGFPKEECVKEAEREKENKGLVKWRSQSNCVMDATTLEAATKCDGT